MPKISVIITTYNREKLLPRAIESVLNQTFKDFELIIVDDGSKDNTKQIIDRYIEKDKRIRYFYQENKGLPSALNKGIELSTGEYIAFLDSDDEWLSKKLEKQFNFLNKNEDFDGVTCYGDIIYEKDDKKIKIGILKQFDKYNNQLKSLINGLFPSIPSSLLLRKKIFKKVGVYDEFLKLSTDSDMMIRIFKAGFKIGVIKEILFIYYIHKQNLTGITSEAKINSLYQRIKETEYLLEKHKDVYGSYKKAKSLMTRYLSTFYKLVGNKKRALELAKQAYKDNISFRNLFHFVLLLLPNKIFLKLYDFKVNFTINKALFINKLKNLK